MDWKKFWNEKGSDPNPLAQVARVGGNVKQQEEVLQQIITHIVSVLQMEQKDQVLDICCGNGLLTSVLAAHCKQITGIDFSETLISSAKKNYPSVRFICADALQLDKLSMEVLQPESVDKINLYFSFQYFENFEQGKLVVSQLLRYLKPGGKLLLGDVPDRSRFFVYYHSAKRIVQLIKQQLQNRNDMGKFWSEEEMQLICKQLDVSGTFLKQPKHLPYAHYRFDYLIEKPA